MRAGLRVFGLILLAAASLVSGSSAWAQSDRSAGRVPVVLGEIPHVAEAFSIDGIMDEAVWAKALMLELHLETEPAENLPAPVETYVYLLETGSELLIAFDARDPEPDRIRAYLRDRDAAWQDDIVGVELDTFNDEIRGFQFIANALGVQIDASLDDNSGDNDSWDAIWDSAGRINETGFVVEMAIPFSQIRFPDTDEVQTWGIDLMRMYPREDRVRLALTAKQRGSNCNLCQFAKVTGFENAEPGKDIEVVPSLTSSRTDRRDSASGALVAGPSNSDVGVNVSWGISPDVTANLAINPDFSQVEADVAQLEVNNTFTLQFAERRPFFLEGANFFATPMQAVFTRTIADPDVGAKLTGRIGDSTYGIFAAADTVTNLIFPGPQGSSSTSLPINSDTIVGRYQYDFGQSSAIGLLLTDRSGNAYSNRVGGIDGRYRWSDRHSISFQSLASSTDYPAEVSVGFGQPDGSFSDNATEVVYDFNTRIWSTSVSYVDRGENFRADAGFIPQVGLQSHNVNFARTWHGESDRWWNRINAGANFGEEKDASGLSLQRWRESFFAIQGPLQSRIQTGFGKSRQFWDGIYYDRNFAFIGARVRPIGGLNIQGSINRQEQIDFANSRLGDQQRYQLQIDWNANRHLLVRLRHTDSTLDTQQGPNVFEALLDDLRLTWQFNVRSFLRLTLQRQAIDRNVAVWNNPFVDARSVSLGTQLLYSYKVNPQTVVFAGYSDNQIENDEFTTLTRTGRTFFVKFSYAWLP